jgi:tetratricopeptide (TPR) repeat protein
MRIPVSLIRRSSKLPADALFLPGASGSTVLSVCVRLGLDPTERLFGLSGGWLLRLDQPSEEPVPDAVRLRALVDRLYLPVDADLLPTLLDDEARGLVRDRGLVFLPNQPPCTFDPLAPVDPTRLLRWNRRPRRDWKPLPRPPHLTERIDEILIDLPEVTADDLLEPGGEAIGTEEPRPPRSGALPGLMGRATLGAGRTLMWLSQSFGLQQLGKLGNDLVQNALKMAPRLSEAVLGRQAAALRSLLDEFRTGDPERALRRAMPLGDDAGPRGGLADLGDRLPEQDTAYSLDSLMGPKSRGPGGFWMGSEDLIAELKREYVKSANEAVRRGDYRRAAFIFGRLLRDYRSAAQALERAGLHRDAAILYLSKLQDERAAARAFEAAGEHDRALQLYRRLEEHLEAGELLRRMGDDEAAREEFLKAADRLTETPGGHLRAGELLLKRVGDPNLAARHFARGWASRPAPNDLECALELAALRAHQGEWSLLLELVSEADAYLREPGRDQASARFYNEIHGLSERVPPETADELRDRALVGLARKLRQGIDQSARPGLLVSSLFARSPHWEPGVVADADFATRQQAKRMRGGRVVSAISDRLQVGHGFVTAVTSAALSGDLFLGFDSGDVFLVRPSTGQVSWVCAGDLSVAALATDLEGEILVVMRSVRSRSGRAHRGRIDALVRTAQGFYEAFTGFPIDDVNEPWLTPVLETTPQKMVGLWDGQALYLQEVPCLAEWGCLTLPDPDARPTCGLLIPPGIGAEEGPTLLIHDGSRWSLLGIERWQPFGPRWTSPKGGGSSLRSAPLSWTWSDTEVLELTGLDEHGALNWCSVRIHHGAHLLANSATTDPSRFLATTLIRPGLVAGITPTRIVWLQRGSEQFAIRSTTPLNAASVVAGFPARASRDLMLVCRDGQVLRVPCAVV